MTKQEFLETLRHALNGNMAAASVEDNIRFYDQYFYTETAKGRTEQDILQELGDPRILARTLIDAADRAGDAYAREANETQYRTACEDEGAGRREYSRKKAKPHDEEMHNMQIPGWLIALVVILVLVVVVSVVGSLVWMVLPYVIPVLLIVYIVKLIRRR